MQRGQLIPKGDNKWLVRVFLGRDGNGNRKYRGFSFTGNLREAEKFRTSKLAEHDGGTLIDISRQTLDEYMSGWLARNTSGVRPNTLEGYRYTYLHYVSPTVGHVRLDQLTRAHVQNLYDKLAARGLAPRTVRLAHAVLHQGLESAVKREHIARNPAKSPDLPANRRKEVLTLSTAELAVLLQTTEDNVRNWAILAFAGCLGLRPSEYLALKWADLDPDSGRVTVQRSLSFLRTGEWYLADTKRPSSRRSLLLPVQLRAALKKVRLEQREARLAAGSNWSAHDFVFSNTIGEPLSPASVYRYILKPLLKLAGLPPITLYGLRHTTATNSVKNGMPAIEVSQLLGHSSVSFTLDTYVQPASSHLDEALIRMGDMTLGQKYDRGM